MNDENILNYTGPSKVYKPAIDNATFKKPKGPGTVASIGGYHDLDELESMLDEIKSDCEWAFTACGNILAKYSAKIDTANAELVKAHDLIYPSDTTPGYITFDEYNYLLGLATSYSVNYLKNFYEETMRGSTGHIALDLLLICKATHAEVGRIRNVITTYIGELDETAEFRTVELFQDWAEQASSLLQRIKKAIQAPVSKGLPRTEVDGLTSELSAQYQALFQIRLNEPNKYISQFMSLLERAWNAPSQGFYEKNLGPGLVFQRKVAAPLSAPNIINQDRFPKLAIELKATMTGMASDFDSILSDQLSRNQAYYSYVYGVLINYEQRDTYKNIIGQLSGKGTTLIDTFVDSSSITQSKDVLDAPNPLFVPPVSLTKSTELVPSHDDLLDRDDPDAHPQYVLSKGGTISGNLKFTPGARIDGIIPSKHRHDGRDGSVKIHGSHIEYGTITDDNVTSDATTNVPSNLSVANVISTFATRVTVELEFDVDPTNVVNYEFQYAKLS